MAQRILSVLVILLLAGIAPLLSAEMTYLYFGGKKYKVEVNGVLGRVCGGKSVQILSPRVDGDPDRPRTALVGDGETFPLEKVKKGEKLGAVTLVTDGESFPFTIEMKEVSVTDAIIRNTGTWTMTLSWSSCSNVPKKK